MLLMPLPAFLRSSPIPEKPFIASTTRLNFSISIPSVIFFIEVRAFVTLSIPPSALSVVAPISNKMLSTLLSGILPPHFVKPCPWVVLFCPNIRKHGELRRTCAVSVRQPIPMSSATFLFAVSIAYYVLRQRQQICLHPSFLLLTVRFPCCSCFLVGLGMPEHFYQGILPWHLRHTNQRTTPIYLKSWPVLSLPFLSSFEKALISSDLISRRFHKIPHKGAHLEAKPY